MTSELTKQSYRIKFLGKYSQVEKSFFRNHTKIKSIWNNSVILMCFCSTYFPVHVASEGNKLSLAYHAALSVHQIFKLTHDFLHPSCAIKYHIGLTLYFAIFFFKFFQPRQGGDMAANLSKLVMCKF